MVASCKNAGPTGCRGTGFIKPPDSEELDRLYQVAFGAVDRIRRTEIVALVAAREEAVAGSQRRLRAHGQLEIN